MTVVTRHTSVLAALREGEDQVNRMPRVLGTLATLMLAASLRPDGDGLDPADCTGLYDILQLLEGEAKKVEAAWKAAWDAAGGR